jgi:hypothetical protein
LVDKQRQSHFQNSFFVSRLNTSEKTAFRIFTCDQGEKTQSFIFERVLLLILSNTKQNSPGIRYYPRNLLKLMYLILTTWIEEFINIPNFTTVETRMCCYLCYNKKLKQSEYFLKWGLEILASEPYHLSSHLASVL